jgi:hypothetical protein
VYADDFCIPDDLREGRTKEEAPSASKDLIRRFGQLLEW